MLLVLDVGNTNIGLGLFRGEALLHQWRVATRREGTPDEYGALL
ncbi:MAG: type III pantothenate kinase, partial [candidate division NC10 bacterium]|nr:type III pantothenate kinase [candidate division NC10 bacterium]